MPRITHSLALIDALVGDRSRLALENIAPRQQIVALKRRVSRTKINDRDRTFWILTQRLHDQVLGKDHRQESRFGDGVLRADYLRGPRPRATPSSHPRCR